MKFKKLSLALLTTAMAANAAAQVYDEASLRLAIDVANFDNSIEKIVFERDTFIQLSAPIVYSGSQSLKLIGKGAIIDGSNAGNFTLDDDLTAVTKDGTLIFNTAGDITIRNLTVANSATRGIVINIPESAEGEDIHIKLRQVNIIDSALYGLRVDERGEGDEIKTNNIIVN